MWAHQLYQEILPIRSCCPTKTCCQLSWMGPPMLPKNPTDHLKWALHRHQETLLMRSGGATNATKKCHQSSWMGPLMLPRNVADEIMWAHQCYQDILPMRSCWPTDTSGPIQGHQSNHLSYCTGPIGDHWYHNFKERWAHWRPLVLQFQRTLDPLEIIGQIFHWQHCAHLRPSIGSEEYCKQFQMCL